MLTPKQALGMEDGMAIIDWRTNIVAMYANQQAAGLGNMAMNAANTHQNAAAQNYQHAFVQYVRQYELAKFKEIRAALAPWAAPSDGGAKPTLRPVRTEEEIAAQLAARMAELEAKAEQAKPPEFACADCKFKNGPFCKNALVVGLDNSVVMNFDMTGTGWAKADLCGPEKALWEQRLTLWERFIAWLEGWGEDRA